MSRSLPYPVYDADNHLYESQEAMTAHLRWPVLMGLEGMKKAQK